MWQNADQSSPNVANAVLKIPVVLNYATLAGKIFTVQKTRSADMPPAIHMVDLSLPETSTDVAP